MVNSKFDLLFMNFGTYRSERYYLFFSLTSSAVSYFFGQMNEKFKDINLIDMTQRSVDHCAHKRHTDGGANFLKKKRLLLRINHQSQKQKKSGTQLGQEYKVKRLVNTLMIKQIGYEQTPVFLCTLSFLCILHRNSSFSAFGISSLKICSIFMPFSFNLQKFL